MNSEQIKDEIRKLNLCDKIGLYRWINEEIAGRPGIGADRSLQIRKEIERMCKAAYQKTHLLERRKRESVEHAEPQFRNEVSLRKKIMFWFWYPSTRLLRQSRAGDWKPVVARLVGLLNALHKP